MKKCSTSLINRETHIETTIEVSFHTWQNGYYQKQTKTNTSVSEDTEKREPCALLVKVYIGAETMEKCMEIPQKI